jgi:hypothetical protein
VAHLWEGLSPVSFKLQRGVEMVDLHATAPVKENVISRAWIRVQSARLRMAQPVINFGRRGYNLLHMLFGGVVKHSSMVSSFTMITFTMSSRDI